MSAKALRASAPRIVCDLPEKSTAPRYGLTVISKDRCPIIGGGYIFGAQRMRIAATPGSLGHRGAEIYLRKLDRILAENEKAVHWTTHREQLAWVFCQLVRTADALGVPVSDSRAVQALDKRLGHSPLGEAMIMCVWTFTLIDREGNWQRENDTDQLRFQDALQDSVERARAFLRGGTCWRRFKSPAQLRSEAWVREQCAAPQKRAA